MKMLLGKVAFWLDHGDICLMTGDFQEHFQHKTWPRSRQSVADWAKTRNYDFLDRKNADPNREQLCAIGHRICITARVNKYHPGRDNTTCPLARKNSSMPGTRAVAVDREYPVTGQASSSSYAATGPTGYPVALRTKPPPPPPPEAPPQAAEIPPLSDFGGDIGITAAGTRSRSSSAVSASPTSSAAKTLTEDFTSESPEQAVS